RAFLRTAMTLEWHSCDKTIALRARPDLPRRPDTIRSGLRDGQWLMEHFIGGEPAMRDRVIGKDLAIAERHDARRVLGDVRLVGDEQHRDATRSVQLLKEIHHFEAGARVEI